MRAVSSEDAGRRVVEQIRVAFSSARVPSVLVRDPHDYCGSELISTFGGRSWEDVSAEDIALHKDDHLQLSLEGLFFLLPAYMVHSIDEPEVTDVAMESTCMNLSPDVLAGVYGAEELDSRVAALTESQVGAISSYLRYASGLVPYAVAAGTASYWGV